MNARDKKSWHIWEKVCHGLVVVHPSASVAALRFPYSFSNAWIKMQYYNQNILHKKIIFVYLRIFKRFISKLSFHHFEYNGIFWMKFWVTVPWNPIDTVSPWYFSTWYITIRLCPEITWNVDIPQSFNNEETLNFHCIT